jgi:hypothetical protein
VVQADLVDDDPPGFDAQPAGEAPLEADRDVAQPHRAVAAVEQRSCDDADRVREVDDPRLRRRQRSHALGDLEDDRDGPHRFGEAAGAGRLLSDAAARERRGLVAQARLLTADADLNQDVVSAVDSRVEVAGHLEPALEALAGEHPPRHPTDDLAPLGVDVLEHELVDVETREPRDELRRVGRASADDSDLHSR